MYAPHPAGSTVRARPALPIRPCGPCAPRLCPVQLRLAPRTLSALSLGLFLILVNSARCPLLTVASLPLNMLASKLIPLLNRRGPSPGGTAHNCSWSAALAITSPCCVGGAIGRFGSAGDLLSTRSRCLQFWLFLADVLWLRHLCPVVADGFYRHRQQLLCYCSFLHGLVRGLLVFLLLMTTIFSATPLMSRHGPWPTLIA
mmetsp:Transcript_51428/g.88523  ORF Transcript_51428/g.88523 Transcript_51428/m.88523 type:complete len:201 (-) Transcript_51428:67-669(-)